MNQIFHNNEDLHVPNQFKNSNTCMMLQNIEIEDISAVSSIQVEYRDMNIKKWTNELTCSHDEISGNTKQQFVQWELLCLK